MAEAQQLVLVVTTVADREAGERLVEALVAERLIACGNLVPGLLSVYRWEGEVAREAEVLVVMKTVGSLVETVFRRAGELHPYALPELVALSAEAVSAAYGRWVRQETIEVSA